MIEFINGKWECDECGNWWSDNADLTCECEGGDDTGDDSCMCEDAETKWCDVCECDTTTCECNPYGTCQCA
jgi:hypothetical protein